MAPLASMVATGRPEPIPSTGPRRPGRALAWLALGAAPLLAMALWGGHFELGPWARQHMTLWHQLTGYTLLALMAAGLVFGLLRRARGLQFGHHAWLFLHQGLGLGALALLAWHAGQWPSGFLRLLMGLIFGMAVLGAGRQIVSTGRWPGLVKPLLALHLISACVAMAAVLGHLVFVFAYTR